MTEAAAGGHDLGRFLSAQAPVIDQVMGELRAGQKQSHWMWFIFPQLVQLGRSETAKFYGLDGAGEARAYAAHPVLGARLEECTRLVIAAAPKTALQILGSPDDLKFRSCCTLFARTAGDPRVFEEALAAFYESPDPRTEEVLASRGNG